MNIDRTTDFTHLPTMLTVEEFLRFAPIPRSSAYHAYQLIRKKHISAVRIGRRLLIARAALIGLLTPKEAV